MEARLEAILSSFSISRSDQRFRKLLGLRKEVKKETSHEEPIKKYYASKGYIPFEEFDRLPYRVSVWTRCIQG